MSQGDKDPLDVLQQNLDSFLNWLHTVPILNDIIRYVLSSIQNDPWRLFLEFVLFVILLRFLFGRMYKPKEKKVKFTKKEIQELVEEWQPEPLVPTLSKESALNLQSVPIIEGPVGTHVHVNGKEVINFVSFNFLNLTEEKRIQEVANESLRKYGVGSCGPPGFYGTIDVHMDLEKEIAKFLGTQEAILYSYAFSTVASSIPAFAKRGDIIVCDSGVCLPIQKGVAISRADVFYFKHNNMEDLERILKQVVETHKKSKKPLTRRFIVTEGLFNYTGDVCPLSEIVELKKKYKFRLMLDESMSFGVLGKSGRGASEHFNVPASEIEVLTGSLSNAISVCGGFCAGSTAVVDHQRLSGQGYCFSASMPALLAKSGLTGIQLLQQEPNRLKNLQENIKLARSLLKDIEPLYVDSSELSPIIFLRLRQRSDRAQDEEYLQKIVDKSLEKGIMITRAKFVNEEERQPTVPGIRLSISSGHREEDIQKLSEVLHQSIKAVSQ